MIEREHPMIAGFFRLKDRRLRRPGFAVDSPWIHIRKRKDGSMRWFLSSEAFGREPDAGMARGILAAAASFTVDISAVAREV
ncbi:MAG: hypothetical protein WCH75_11770 [Candidatus Binatia bacterium]